MVAATEFLGPDSLFDDPTAPVRILVDKEAVWTKKLGGSNHVKHDVGAVW